jgi:hypothetical protein
VWRRKDPAGPVDGPDGPKPPTKVRIGAFPNLDSVYCHVWRTYHLLPYWYSLPQVRLRKCYRYNTCTPESADCSRTVRKSPNTPDSGLTQIFPTHKALDKLKLDAKTKPPASTAVINLDDRFPDDTDSDLEDETEYVTSGKASVGKVMVRITCFSNPGSLFAHTRPAKGLLPLPIVQTSNYSYTLRKTDTFLFQSQVQSGVQDGVAVWTPINAENGIPNPYKNHSLAELGCLRGYKTPMTGNPVFAQTHVPSWWRKESTSYDLPKSRLKLNWAYGYRGHDTRQNCFYNSHGEVVYHTAALGVVYNPIYETQRHVTDDPESGLVAEGNTDDILCMVRGFPTQHTPPSRLPIQH